ncbi:uncharacterized protein AstCC [Panulirus ornatus]|uniref:uncharacterized protein AstCC n=1 Tax=Panulirus ornatus TaxID=150431 RepID=UPI003A8471F8
MFNGTAGGEPVVPDSGRSTTSVAATARSLPPMLPLLLLLLLLLLVGSPAAARVPQPAPRPQFLEEVRPVLPEQPMVPLGSPQEVVEQIPERVSEPRKRAAIALDKLMFALQKALDDPPQAPPPGTAPSYPRPRAIAAGPVRMDLQRRGNGDGRLYWRCYFNAVSCF